MTIANDLRVLSTMKLDQLCHEMIEPVYPLIVTPDDEQETIRRMMPETVCLVSRGLTPIGPVIMDGSEDLLVITRTGAGYENVDIDAATKRGIPVVYAPLLADAVAEATFAMILALNKRLFYWHKMLLDGQWERRALERVNDLFDTTIGNVGMGRIGLAVAVRAKAFGMLVLGYDPYVKQLQVDDIGVRMTSFDELLANSDVISLHAIVSDETTHMINRDSIRKIKPGATLINFARGALIESNDILYEALDECRLGAVGLDVFPQEPPADLDHPLFHHPNFIGSPHVLASSRGAEERCVRSWTTDVLAVLRGERPRWCINPQVFDAPNFRRAGSFGRHCVG